MTSRPKLAFAMSAERTKYAFDAVLLDRLSAVCDIIDPQPFEAFSGPRVHDILGRTEILVTGWGCPAITPAVLAMAPRLRLIAHAAGTVKSFIHGMVYETGIAVTHAADANAVPVAEFAVAAILFSNKHVFTFRDLYRADPSRASTYALMNTPIGNYGRTIGLIGASRIGRRVVDLLQPFDFDILLHDPFVGPGDPVAHRTEIVGLDELMRRSDVVSVHAPSLPTTQRMIGQAQLALMRDGAALINTARGALIDEDALLAELETGRIRAVIDVTDPEIPAPSSPFYRLPNVFLTPHIAGAAGTERRRLGDLVVEEIERFVAGEPLKYAIEQHLLERLA